MVVLAGEVAGNVEVVAQEIEVLPTARIRGKLVYWSPRPARIDPQASISGRVTHNLPELPSRIARTGTALVTVSRTSFMAGLTVIAVALFLIFPRFTVLASRTVGSDPIKSLGMGLLLFAAIPVLAILSMITILGIPLGLLIFLGFPSPCSSASCSSLSIWATWAPRPSWAGMRGSGRCVWSS